ncbi:hypothetical protein RHMOL_Rhmol04G0278100 [Rhododendron molle]|uniref:Uncharacterized protein n=1 Tax=Rhododendron molle TaxID=49168 RepID=A0ACC0P6E6_RHOML|nr:hypothetical protein RHMOL_Rhmol04G0278100 [Rhododendron molle]
MVAMTCFQKQALLFVLKWTFVFWINAVSSFAELQRFTHPGKGDGSLSFLVVGDWGRDGLYNQSEVAFQMGRIGEELDLDFVVSTGDNFYDNGLKAVNDPAFRESFSEIYSYKSLRKPWYSVLGNHDYRGDVKAQLDPILRRIDRRWFCLRSFVLNAAEIADFFFVDTTPFVDAYFNEPEDHIYDWRGIYPRETYVSNLLKDLNSALRESTAKWKIVVGHHSIRSVGHHGDTHELVHRLLPILEANNVDFYMNGHDHCLERISCHNSRIQFLTSGAGSKAWRGDEKLCNDCAVHFFYDGQGFMSVQLSSTNAQMRFYDVEGKAMYQWNVTRQLHFHSEM